MNAHRTAFSRLVSTTVATALLLIAGSAQAALVSFSGNFSTYNDVARIAFTLKEDMNDFRLWTDSYRDVINFDPAIALWRADNGNLVAWNDDEYIDPGQTDGDAGFFFTLLTAGDYILTLITAPNDILGSNLADGFFLDAELPMPLDTGSFWRVWMTTTQSAVPEPALLALLLIGALGAGIARTGRTHQKQTSCSV